MADGVVLCCVRSKPCLKRYGSDSIPADDVGCDSMSPQAHEQPSGGLHLPSSSMISEGVVGVINPEQQHTQIYETL
jgi:hypothetical protein